MTPHQHARPDELVEASPVTVYWRPGCPFCWNLFRQLDRRDVPYRRIDIHQDPTAASRVREITGGDETVPTVEIGAVTLVNPSIARVIEIVVRDVPGLLPDRDGDRTGGTGRLVERIPGLRRFRDRPPRRSP